VGVEELGSGFSVTTDIPGENTGAAGAIGLVKDFANRWRPVRQPDFPA
jgi:hypothetical protein